MGGKITEGKEKSERNGRIGKENNKRRRKQELT